MGATVTNGSNKRQINKSINVLKCLAIFAVICIHCKLFNLGAKGGIVVALCRFAVPFFFMVSGYFSFFDNRSKALEKYKVRALHLLKLLIVSNVIYFIYYDLIRWYSVEKIISLFYIDNIFEYIIFNVSPTGGHLWFIQALIYCYILFYVLAKLDINANKLYKYVPILLLLCLLFGEFSHLTANPYPYYFNRSFIFTGLPFFVLGYLIHDKEHKMENISDRFIIYTFILGVLLTVIECLTVGKVEMYFGSILISSMIFIYCVKYPLKLDYKVTGWIGGKLYTPMYLLHLIPYYAIVVDYTTLSFISPFIVFFITLFLSLIVYFLDTRLNIKIF